MNTKNYFAQTFAFQLLALLFAGCASNENSHTGQQREWQTMSISRSDISLHTRYSASIQGKQDIEIRPQVAGTIISVHINEGERVRKGQTLFVIDQVPYRAALNQAQANVKAAEATVATATLNHQTRQRLFAEKVISQYDLQTAENEKLKAEAELAQAEANVLNARNNLSYTEVRSPADGVAGMIPYRQGALVDAAIAQPLTTVSDNSEMYVYFSMNESQMLSFMRRHGSMDEMIKNFGEVELLLSDGARYVETGRIESVSGVIDRSTGSVTLRAVFPNRDRILLSGSSGNVQIPTMYNNVILIPQAATMRIQDQFLVYTVVNGKAQSAQISIATENNGKEYIVTEGLNEGDVIVSDGAGLVREGMEITPKK